MAFTAFDNSDSFPIDTRGASGGATLGLVIEGSNDFGAVTVGASALRVLTLRNQTASPMTIGAATNLPFTMEGASAVNLAANGIGVLGVRFAPVANGLAIGALELTGGPNPITIPLSGRGVGTNPTSAPVLGSVTPNPVTGSNASRTMTLTGTGFDSAMKVTWKNLTSGQIYKDRVPTTVTATQAVIGAVFGESASQWTAQVVNPDKTESNVVSFNVTAPGAPVQLGMRFENEAGISIGGACTDGAAIVRVVVTNVPDSVAASGIAIEPPSSEWASAGPVQRDTSTDKAWKDFTVPDRYPGGTAPTEDVVFTATAGASAVQGSISLMRPPVVLVHGLWSSRSTFDTMKRELQRVGYEAVLDMDYSYSSSASFNANRDRVGTEMIFAVRSVTSQGYACKRADVVGHSMGGILTRYYTQNLGASFEYRNDIRKIITIGTPHAGSEMANVLMPVRAYLSVFPQLDAPLRARWDINLQGEAVRDLQISSTAMLTELNGSGNFPSHKVPAHAIVGSFPTTVERGLIGAIMTVVRIKAPFLNLTTLMGTPNDVLVRGTSQQGGLSDDFSTEVPVFLGHFGETDSSLVIQNVKSLLDSPTTGPASPFDPNGFDEPVTLGFFDYLETVLALWSLPSPGQVPPGLASLGQSVEITQPTDGMQFSPGAIVSVHVDAGAAVTKTMIASSESAVITAPPFEFHFQIPLEFTGPLEIYALGSDETDSFYATDSVTIQVSTTATLQAVRILPNNHATLLVGTTQTLTTLGDFSDGATRDITQAGSGTAYSVTTSTIVNISADGVVQALQPGFTFLTATNGDRSDEIVVEVLSEAPEPESTDGAAIVSTNVPTQLASSHPFPAKIVMQNTGDLPWSAAEGYALAVVSDACGMITGTRIPISGGAVVQPGQTYSFDFSLDVPDSTGLCSFQLQMVRDVESESNFFGALVGVSTEVITAVNNATFESTTMLASMKPGQGLWFSISVRNTGTTLWFEGSNHSLGAVSDPNNILGGITRFPIPFGQTIQSNKVAQFLVYFKAPQVPGDYPVQFRMIEEFFEWFGEEINLNIHVEIPPNQVRGWETYE